MDEYRARKDKLKLELSEALSSIHLSFDTWSSPNGFSILSVFAHYIDSGGNRRTRAIAFRRLRGEHSSENIGDKLLEIIGEYGFGGRVGYFQADNATNNDTAIEHVLKALYPNMSAKQRRSFRLRCLGHISNLCARAILLGRSSSKMLKELELSTEKGAWEKVEAF